MWKVVEGVMDERLAAIKLHDCLNGSVKSRGTGTATIKVKLAQQLAWLEQEPLYGVFLESMAMSAHHGGIRRGAKLPTPPHQFLG